MRRERRFERREIKDDGGGAAPPLTAAAVKTGDGGGAVSTRSPVSPCSLSSLFLLKTNEDDG
ncbi:hypothetical protein HanPI659440_Chr09g0334251 [Helianthus annuus]|nr:hypothetical protein HanPI659440_Chr09g0334251 [Helianthus annuus]